MSSNNIYPAKWKPRNGDLGVDRDSLTRDTCASAIGERRALKTILKTAKKERVSKRRVRNIWFKFVSSLPYGNKYAQKKLHKRNEKRFSDSMARLGVRATTLEKLWSVKKLSLTNDDSLNFDTNNLSDQLQICENLGIKEMVLKRFSEKITGSDDCSSCSDGHGHGHHDHDHGHHDHDHGHGHGHHDHGHGHHDHGHDHGHGHHERSWSSRSRSRSRSWSSRSRSSRSRS